MQDSTTGYDIARKDTQDFLAGGGELGALMRSMDWSRTPLGPIENWPQSLRSAVGILLPSRTQIILFWGPDLIVMYNDAYRPVLGVKHPWALGRPGREAWSEIWDDTLHPLLERVLQSGEAFWAADHPFFPERHGFPEETYFDISYDPLRDESGRVGGVFCIVSETTGRVIGQRRLRTLREISEVASSANDDVAAFRAVADALSRNPRDVPFALFYDQPDPLVPARCVAASGIESQSADLWPLAQAAAGRDLLLEAPALSRMSPLVAGHWPEPVKTALVLPILAGGQVPTGYVVAGASPRLPFDDAYRDFLRLVATNTASAVSAVRALAEERQRAEALAELNRAKTAFFSNVSHEFRTPLTLILSPVEDAIAGGEQALETDTLQSIHRNSLRLLRLVNMLLDFSRLEEGHMAARYQPADISELTRDTASAFRSAVEKAGIALVVDCPDVGESVYIDCDMWEKIVLNLVSNAFKFTKQGEIEVGVRREGGHALLWVRDTGAGIPQSEIPRLFERFHRVEGTEGRTYEGTGIGLALVRELVNLHGGSVFVESKLGKGSTFTVAIPLGSAHLPVDRIAAATSDARDPHRVISFTAEADRWNPGDGASIDSNVTNSQLAPSGAKPAKRARILIVDDNADMRDHIRRILRSRFDVDIAEHGKAALDAVKRAVPDLIISDVMMPMLDGIGLLSALRSDSATQAVPVILLSARAGPDAGIEGLQAGADDYLIKPFSARELMARVGAQLRIVRLRDEATAALHTAFDREHRIATTFQNALFAIPAEDAFEGMRLYGRYEPAWDEAEVGGDFIDAFALGNGQVALVVGDVSGKGLAAAARTAEIRFTLRSFLREDPRAGATLGRLNDALCDSQALGTEPVEGFGCLALAVLAPSTGEIAIACAGAEPPMIVRTTGMVDETKLSGTPLAVARGMVYTEASFTIEPGDIVAMTTDGITEARRGKEFFGYDRLVETAAKARSATTLCDMANAILTEAREFGGGLRDDACVLLAKRT